MTIDSDDLAALSAYARACEIADAEADLARMRLRVEVLRVCARLGCTIEDIDAAMTATRAPTERMASVAATED
jgi:hypothetical protein